MRENAQRPSRAEAPGVRSPGASGDVKALPSTPLESGANGRGPHGLGAVSVHAGSAACVPNQRRMLA